MVGSWDDLCRSLRECHKFLESAYAGTPFAADEWTGAAHCARLLGHTTDALLLAIWIQGVGEAYERLQKKDGAERSRGGGA